jgi:hypothetical protein
VRHAGHELVLQPVQVLELLYLLGQEAPALCQLHQQEGRRQVLREHLGAVHVALDERRFPSRPAQGEHHLHLVLDEDGDGQDVLVHLGRAGDLDGEGPLGVVVVDDALVGDGGAAGHPRAERQVELQDRLRDLTLLRVIDGVDHARLGVDRRHAERLDRDHHGQTLGQDRVDVLRRGRGSSTQAASDLEERLAQRYLLLQFLAKGLHLPLGLEARDLARQQGVLDHVGADHGEDPQQLELIRRRDVLVDGGVDREDADGLSL